MYLINIILSKNLKSIAILSSYYKCTENVYEIEIRT
jgi:hypothetical protein